MSEEEKRELADAEAEFSNEKQTEEQKLPDRIMEHIERNQEILTALGFTPHYHDTDQEGNDETNFGIRVMNTKIGIKFNDKYPAGLIWGYTLTEDGKKDFIKNGSLKELPLVQRYHDIQAGKKPIPEPTVTGRIIERRSKSVVVEIEEDGKKKEVIFGWGAVKKHDDGHHFIPHGFSKPSQDNPEGKMYVPRDILLPEMDSQAVKPTTIPIPAAAPQPPAAKPTDKENLTVPGLIEKYLSIAVQVTKAVKENEEVSAQEAGYVTNWVCNKVVDELVNGKGGDQEGA